MLYFVANLYDDFDNIKNRKFFNQYFRHSYTDKKDLENDIQKAYNASGAFLLTCICIEQYDGNSESDIDSEFIERFTLSEYKETFIDTN